MIDVDRAVIQNILSLIPYSEWSPLFDRPVERKRFERWCAESVAASRLVAEALNEAPLLEWDKEGNAFVVAVEYDEAEAMIRRLIVAYEDRVLRRLFSH